MEKTLIAEVKILGNFEEVGFVLWGELWNGWPLPCGLQLWRLESSAYLRATKAMLAW